MLHCWIGDYNGCLRVLTSTEITLVVVMLYIVALGVYGSVEVVLIRIVDEAVMYPSNAISLLMRVEVVQARKED